MAQTSTTFRVFVSSTFSDLIAERNALQERVFSRLRELCQRHGCRFQAIDLRWGVSEEAGMDQQTMNICLQELQRCRRLTPRPNFIVLLGDRYGWRPLPPQVEAAEFEQILTQVSPDERDLLVFSDNQPDDRRGWYRRDDNAVPAQYCLRPIRPPEAPGWAAMEKTLRAILLRAIGRLGWPADDPRRVKYEASATHQEILHGALNPQPSTLNHSSDHAFGFFRTIRDLPRDASVRDFIDLGENGQPDTDAQARLSRLKDQLRAKFPANVSDYEAVWAGNGPSSDHLAGLCDMVYERLSRVILDEVRRLEQADAVDQEAIAHEDFGRERARHFIGRADLLRRIEDYLQGTDNHPLVIHGVSGSGKSALLAKAATDYASRITHHEAVVRYIGATPASSDIRSLLEELCREISLRYGAEEAVPAEYRKLVEEFPKRLALATVEKPLVVFLDALDQLSDAEQGRNLAWLPAQLPAHVRLILSTLPGECLTALQQRMVGQASSLPINESQAGMLAPPFLEVTPMSAVEGEALLDAWLQEAGRTLQPEQRREVLARFGGCPLPLYLKLAFEEARRWKSWERSVGVMGDVSGVLGNLFVRLEQPQHHGRMLVSRAMGYLAAGRHGLTEDELLDVLSADKDVLADFRRRSPRSPEVNRLPVVIWSRLYADLESYLAERQADNTTVLNFYHRQLREAVEQRYLERKGKMEAHRHLAGYFECQPLWRGHEGGKNLNFRKVSEQIWQLPRAEEWERLKHTLAEIEFLSVAWQEHREEILQCWARVQSELRCSIADVYGPRWQSAMEQGHDPTAAAELCFMTGHVALADEIVQRLDKSYENRPLKKASLVEVLKGQAAILCARGHPQKARPLYKRCIALCDELGDVKRRVRLLGELAAVTYPDDPAEALRTLRQQEADLRKSMDLHGLQLCLGNLANILKDLGDIAAALDHETEAIRICTDLGVNTSLQQHRAQRAILLVRLGRWQEALEVLEDAEKQCRRFDYTGILANCLAQQGSVLARYGSAKRALEKYAEAERLYRQATSFPQLARCLMDQAALCLKAGEKRHGQQKASEAMRIILEQGQPEQARAVCAGLLYQLQKLA